MSDYKITTCSVADISREHFEARDISWVPFYYNIDGAIRPDDLGASIPYDEYYRMIEQGASPTTSQPNADDYKKIMIPILESGKDILHISVSSAISGAINSASNAVNELRELYPDRKIYLVDSLCISTGLGLFVDMLADKRDEGLSVDELYTWAEDNKRKIDHWFISTDLTNYFRGGRMSKASFAIGQILNICPLMNVDDNGALTPRFKIRTKKKALKAMLDKMVEKAKDGTEYSGKCYINHSLLYGDARALADSIEETFPKLNGRVEINNIGTVIGAHTGYGTIALFFEGKDRNE